ncbi:class IV adenylate cyclase [bacterium]|nr:class IV adenylate cyclase [bacterium]
MLEIELKARVRDHGSVESRLSTFMTYGGPIDKRDEYWSIPLAVPSPSGPGFRFRLRCEPGSDTVTFKEKTYTSTVEINKETEFGVADAAAFRAFLAKMSAKLLYRKSKKGGLWRGSDGIIAELVRVEGLGEYLEVEILCEENPSADVDRVKKRLIAVIERCGLPASDIEPRPYSQLLGVPGY